ncbi:MAG TPA: transporter associated domain-containing protein, partial [Phototrophicaceae bacterium]|nr:transporter associated domain-containing protein [Phototrophicaceae bacterium]
LEELVGEVNDEFDVEDDETASKPDRHLLEGMMSITAAEERLGELKDEVQSNTLGGYISEQLERIPEVGDRVRFGNYMLTVEAMDGLRVDRIRFSKAESSVTGTSEQ